MIRQPTGKIPIIKFLENLSDETGRLAVVVSDLDDLMATMAVAPSSLTAEQLHGLQSVDALRQALEAIAQITRSAANSIPADADTALSRSDLAGDVNIQKVRDACLGLGSAHDFNVPPQGQTIGADETVFFDEA